jgi:hypothetical protein
MHELTYFCRTCDIPICTACAVTNHCKPDHDYTALADVVQEQKTMIESTVRAAQGRALEVTALMDVVRDMQPRIQRRSDDVLAETGKAFTAAHKALDNRQAAVVLQIEAVTQDKAKELAEQEESLGMIEASLTSAVEFAQATLACGNDAEVLLCKSKITRRLTALMQQECCLDPVATDRLDLRVNPATVRTLLEQFCTVHVPAVRRTNVGAAAQAFVAARARMSEPPVQDPQNDPVRQRSLSRTR